MNAEKVYVTCSCCGALIGDNADENVNFGTGHDDVGMGACVECFGDKRVAGDDEPAVRKRLGWAGEAFYDARIKMLKEKLSPENSAKFSAMTYAKQVCLVARMVERGAII